MHVVSTNAGSDASSDESDSESAGVKPARVRPEGEASDEEIKKPSANKSTYQLLFIGSGLAICGLLVSFLLLVYRTQCSVDDRVGTYSNRSGETEMCYEHYKQIDKMPSEIAQTDDEEMLVDVPAAPCRDDTSCRAYRNGFCGGGRNTHLGMLRLPEYCSNGANSCSCQTTIQQCGTGNYFTFSFEPEELLYRCEGKACSETLSIKVPYWPTERMGVLAGGCERARKCTLEDVQIWVQHECEDHHLYSPVNPEARKWKEVQHELDEIPDVSFGFFWPSTISESVSKAGSAEKTIFFGMMLCASLCLLASKYVTKVTTVDLPSLRIPIIGVEFNTMRSWFPPIGLILLSAVPMVPSSQMHDLPSALLTLVHLVGAQFCFVVYLLCEGMALLDPENKDEIEKNHHREWHVRFALFLTGSTAMVLFVTSWGSLAVFQGGDATPYLASAVSGWGFCDFYKTRHTGETLLLRPADGTWQKLKILSYAAEFIVSMAILCNMLSIWFFNQASVEELRPQTLAVVRHERSDPEHQRSAPISANTPAARDQQLMTRGGGSAPLLLTPPRAGYVSNSAIISDRGLSVPVGSRSVLSRVGSPMRPPISAARVFTPRR